MSALQTVQQRKLSVTFFNNCEGPSTLRKTSGQKVTDKKKKASLGLRLEIMRMTSERLGVRKMMTWQISQNYIINHETKIH